MTTTREQWRSGAQRVLQVTIFMAIAAVVGFIATALFLAAASLVCPKRKTFWHSKKDVLRQNGRRFGPKQTTFWPKNAFNELDSGRHFIVIFAVFFLQLSEIMLIFANK